MTTGGDELLNDQELAVALIELTLEGLIEWKGEEELKLSEKGDDYAWGLWKKLPPRDRLAVYMLFLTMEEVLEDGNKA